MHHSRGVQVAHGHTDATRATWGVGVVPSAVLLRGALRSALWRSLCHLLLGGTKINLLGKIRCDPGRLQWYTDDILLFAILMWASSCYWNMSWSRTDQEKWLLQPPGTLALFLCPPCLTTVSLTCKMKIIKNILLKASGCISEMMCAEGLAHTKCPIGYHFCLLSWVTTDIASSF